MDYRKPLVLIVDDVPENIQVLLQILEKEKYRFAIATNADEAFKSIYTEKPDLILLDIILPNINGYEICKQLKGASKTKDIPVVFLTVLDEMDDVLKGFDAGAVDYITKPFNEHEVLARVNTQLNLQQAHVRLKELNETKDKLFSIIAHEIRNPFSNIINFSELILENIDNYNKEKLKEVLRAVHIDALKSFDMLENLLMWSRSQLKDNLKVNMQPVLLNELVDEVLTFHKEALINKDLQVAKNIDISTMIFADINMAKTIIRNLISNAIKFTNQGEIRLTSDESDDQVLFQVQDTGMGIEEKNLDNIFDLNYFTTKGTYEEAGSGLGLVITKEFVELNGGKISVDSKPGEGSNFTVSFHRVK